MDGWLTISRWSFVVGPTKSRSSSSKRRRFSWRAHVALAHRWPADSQGTMPDRPDQTTMRSESAIPRVLIADDQPDVLEALRLLLKGEGYKIESAGSPAAILEAVDSTELDAVLMDLNYARDTTSGQEGLDLLSQIRGHDPTLPVVVM